MEVGIAEQNLADRRRDGQMQEGPFACSPACFLSMRSIEQIKTDVAIQGMSA